MTVNLHFRQWFTGPVTSYDEAADVLPLELEREDNIEWLEVNDYVRIERLVARADAKPSYGTIRRVNAETQYALVELEVSGFWEWVSLDETFLVMKAAALAAADEQVRTTTAS